MNATQNLQNWSIGTSIHLPKEVIEKAHFSVNEPLKITIQNKVVVLTSLKKKRKITLKNLLKHVRPQDIGGELVWGKDIGTEVYA